jgi:hypothetical protein
MPPIDVPPPVPGDPAGMRALAATLRAVADSVESDDASVASAVGGMTFRGPAASRLRSTVAGVLGGSAPADLNGVADQLVRAAAQVEQAQAERSRLMRLAAEHSG